MTRPHAQGLGFDGRTGLLRTPKGILELFSSLAHVTNSPWGMNLYAIPYDSRKNL